MKYLIAYLAIGVVTLAVILIQQYLQRRRDVSRDFVAMLAALKQEKKSFGEFLAERLASILGGLVVITGWPVAIIVLIKTVLSDARRKKVLEQNKFRIRPEDLLEKITIKNIEILERVVEPFDAVPDLPFGHLNAAWMRYLDELPIGSELWSFATQWTPPYGEIEKVEGYVARANDEMGPHFITIQRELEENETAEHV